MGPNQARPVYFLVALLLHKHLKNDSGMELSVVTEVHTKATRFWIAIVVPFELRVTFCTPIAAVFKRGKTLSEKITNKKGEKKKTTEKGTV